MMTIAEENVSENGKSAWFEFILLTDIVDGEFDLYDVIGGGGLSADDSTLAILPINLGDADVFTTIRDGRNVMFTFFAKNIQTDNPTVNTFFSHFGSLFPISVKKQR